MRYLSNLHEKRCFCVRFALFFAQNTVSYTFLPVFCTHTKNWFFPLFWHFYP